MSAHAECRGAKCPECFDEGAEHAMEARERWDDELRAARMLIAALLRTAGGSVFVPDSVLVALNGEDWISRFDHVPGGRTYALIPAGTGRPGSAR